MMSAYSWSIDGWVPDPRTLRWVWDQLDNQWDVLWILDEAEEIEQVMAEVERKQ